MALVLIMFCVIVWINVRRFLIMARNVRVDSPSASGNIDERELRLDIERSLNRALDQIE